MEERRSALIPFHHSLSAHNPDNYITNNRNTYKPSIPLKAKEPILGFQMKHLNVTVSDEAHLALISYKHRNGFKRLDEVIETLARKLLKGGDL